MAEQQEKQEKLTLEEARMAGSFDVYRFEEEELEGFHDRDWTGRKLWVLGAITLIVAFIAIYAMSETMSRPM